MRVVLHSFSIRTILIDEIRTKKLDI